MFDPLRTVHLVAFDEAFVLLVDSGRRSGECPDVLIQIPAQVLIKHRGHQVEFFVIVFLGDRKRYKIHVELLCELYTQELFISFTTGKLERMNLGRHNNYFWSACGFIYQLGCTLRDQHTISRCGRLRSGMHQNTSLGEEKLKGPCFFPKNT